MSDLGELAARIEALDAAPVAVVGDVMLDRFIVGRVERVSPEAPIPVLQVQRDSAMAGGAGNVLRNLAALGARGSLVAALGDDPAGQELSRLLSAQGADSDGLIVVPGRPTTIKERFLAGAQQLLRVDRETAAALPPDATAALDAAALRHIASCRALVLSDYGKGVLTPAQIAALIESAHAAGCPVVVDPKGDDFTLYRGATVITPNRQELERASRMATDSDGAVVAACQAVIEQAAVEHVLATRSEAGMTLVSRDGSTQHLRAVARAVYDVSGAGDTVVAALAAALAAGLSLNEAAALANVAAGIVVGKVGTAVVEREELRHALQTAELLAAERKVVGLDELVEQATRWRRAGLKIGLTNGCFDLLHPGHVSLLHQAKAACDGLVVALNSDASVKRLKGEGRPVQSETARATLLASLRDVDRVVIFGEDTPIRVIEALRPELLVKGADYRIEQVVGGDLVTRYGGKILLAEILPGHSTTQTIERLE